MAYAAPVEFSHFDDGKFAGVSAYEVNGAVFHTKVDLDDFPKDFARLEDLESAVRVRSIDADAADEPQCRGDGPATAMILGIVSWEYHASRGQ